MTPSKTRRQTRVARCCLALTAVTELAGCSNSGPRDVGVFQTASVGTEDSGGSTSFTSTAGGTGDGSDGSGSVTANGSGSEADGSGTASTAETTDGSSTTTNDTDVKFDMSSSHDSEGDSGGTCGCNAERSYVFIANTNDATMSKINTRTLVEEGRYATGGISPSRTSVSIDAKAVVVANRGTGIAKYWAMPEFCDPNANGVAGLQTSKGKFNVLPFREDDCLAWYTEFPGKTVQRPVQWASGTFDPETCTYQNQKVWTVTGAMGFGPTFCGASGVWVHRLNGDTGVIEDEIHIPNGEFPCGYSNEGTDVGAYGGAVDADGNFWFHNQFDSLARIDYDTLDYEIFPLAGYAYGITVDTQGRVWFSGGLNRFDYTTKEWKGSDALFEGGGGIAQDFQNRIWMAGNNDVTWVNMETFAIGDTVTLPGEGQVKGVSVDMDGYIWAVLTGGHAHKIHPNTYARESYDGLNDPYTYSDMTGGALYNVNCKPAR